MVGGEALKVFGSPMPFFHGVVPTKKVNRFRPPQVKALQDLE